MKRFDQLSLQGGDPPKPAPKKERGLPRALPPRLKPQKGMSDRTVLALAEWALKQPDKLTEPLRDHTKRGGDHGA